MIVIDASAVIEILLGTRLARQCRDRVLDSGDVCCAPHLIDVEVAQVLRRYAARSVITDQRGEQALEDLLDLPIERYPYDPLLARVWQLRHSVSAYDAVYVALAEVLEARLVTCDARLAGSHGHCVQLEVIT